MVIKIKTKKLIGYRISDIGPDDKDYNIKTDDIWDKQRKRRRS